MRRTAAVAVIAVPALLIGAGTATAVHRYSDVPDDHTHAAGIEWSADQGLVQGYPDGTFRPENPVTRGQLATVLERQHAWRGPVYTLSQECGTAAMLANDHNRIGSGTATVEYAVDGGTRQELPPVPPDEPLSFTPGDPGLITLFVDGIAWASTPTGETCVPPA
jgi:hypothetical protein